MDKSELIKSIKQGDDEAYSFIYREYRESFVKWAEQNFKVDREEALDVFQDTLVRLFTNVVKGRLDNLSSNFKTYLFAIGKHVLLDKMKRVHRLLYVEKFEPEMEKIAEELKDDPQEMSNERRQKLMKVLSELEEPCYTILEQYYFKGFSMEMIAYDLNYKNKNVAKTMKMRCLKKLKKAILNS